MDLPTIIPVQKNKKTIAENCILIGSKPFGAYIKSVTTLFRGKGLKEIDIKARGKNIKKAIDITECSRRKFCHDLNIKVKEVKIGTEEFAIEGKQISVSTISISLTRD